MYRLIYQDGDTPQTYTFTAGEVVIGRSPDCQVVLKDFGISRNHAKLIVDEDGVRILDLKSKNGTQVNGVPVVEAPLKDGDRILLGKFQLTFSKTPRRQGRARRGQAALRGGGHHHPQRRRAVASCSPPTDAASPSAAAEAKKAPATSRRSRSPTASSRS